MGLSLSGCHRRSRSVAQLVLLRIVFTHLLEDMVPGSVGRFSWPWMAG